MANEHDSVAAFLTDLINKIDRLNRVEIFTVFDTVSKDGTIDIVRQLAQREPRIKIVWAPENRSVVDAYVRGYREALASGADWILEIDAGYSHSPAEISHFIRCMEDGYDCVFGSRFCAGGKMLGSGWLRYLTSKGGTLLTNFLIGTRLKDMTSGFQMFRREALDQILSNGLRSRGPFFQTEMKIYSRFMNTCEIPIRYRATSNEIRQGSIVDALNMLMILFFERIKGTLPPLRFP